MHPTLKLLSAATLAVTLAACGKSNDAAKPVAPPPPKETVFDDLIATKARTKQQTDQAVQQNKEKMDAAMKQIDEGAAPQ